MKGSATMLIARSPVMRLIRAATPLAPQWLRHSLGSSNFSCPVIAVRELVCHKMSGDNTHFFRSTRLNPIPFKLTLAAFYQKQRGDEQPTARSDHCSRWCATQHSSSALAQEAVLLSVEV